MRYNEKTDINIFSDDIRVYEYALNQIPGRKDAIEPSYVRNDTLEHTIIVIQKLFERVQKEIYIKSSVFCREIYLNEKIINTLKQLKKSIKINILIEQKSNNKLIGQKEVIKKFNKIFDKNNIKINYINKNKKQKVNDFIIVDEYDFRYELEKPKSLDRYKNKDFLNIKASACFNTHKNKDYNRTIKLKKVFDYLSI